MERHVRTVNLTFYEIEYQLGEDILRYCFEIKQGAEICFYSRYGITGKKKKTIMILLFRRDLRHPSGRKVL